MKQPLCKPKSNKTNQASQHQVIIQEKHGKTHNRNYPVLKSCEIRTLQEQLKTKFITKQKNGIDLLLWDSLYHFVILVMTTVCSHIRDKLYDAALICLFDGWIKIFPSMVT